MYLIPILVFFMVLVIVVGGVLVLGLGHERKDIEKRLSGLGTQTKQGDLLPAILKSQSMSDVPLLNRILSNLNFSVRVDRQLHQAGLGMKVGTFVLLSLTLFALGTVGCMLLEWPLVFALAAGIALGYLPKTVVTVKRRIREKNFTTHFPDALEMFARSLRAGHSFAGAIELVAEEMPDPVGPEFRKVFDEQNLGIPLRQALIGMTERIDTMDVKFLVTAILIHRETGGNLAEIIDKISYVIRERFRIQGQLRIFTAQARLTGIILSLFPVGAALVIGLLNPQYLKPLWTEPVGRIMVMIAVTLQFLGTLVIRKIVRIKI